MTFQLQFQFWRGRGVYCFTSVLPSVQDIFRRIFLSNCWWQKSDIWSQASYRYTILWVAFLDPSDSYFLFADLVGFIHIEHICSFFVAFFSATIDGRNLIFSHKLLIGTPISWEAFFEPSDSYFLFAKERGYHMWALAHSSSCSVSLILRA
jgi:hypothetical protein